MDYVFVVTYGRSGSTLMQGLLNAIPRTLVRGENNMFVLPIFKSYQRLTDWSMLRRQNSRKRGTESAHFGMDEVDPQAFIEDSRALIVRQLLGESEPESWDRIGFKEIRWHHIAEPQVPSFFDFFDAVFPNASFILHRRDHRDVMVSSFWRKMSDDRAKEALARAERLQDFLASSRPDRVLATEYETLTDPRQQGVQLRRITEFVLGSCPVEVLDGMRATTATPHGPPSQRRTASASLGGSRG